MMTSRRTRESYPPSISVVIPTFNRPDELRLCLQGLASQTIPRERST